MPGALLQQQSISRLVKVLFIARHAPQIRALYVSFFYTLKQKCFLFSPLSFWICIFVWTLCNISSCVNCLGYLSSCPWCLPRLFHVASSITPVERSFLGSGRVSRGQTNGRRCVTILNKLQKPGAASAFWSHLRLKCPSWFSDARENHLHGHRTSQEC